MSSSAERDPNREGLEANELRERLPFRDRFTQVAESFWSKLDTTFETLDWESSVRNEIDDRWTGRS